MMSVCPSRMVLEGLLAETLGERERSDAWAHIETCPRCQGALEEIMKRSDPEGLARIDDPPAPLPAPGFLSRLKELPLSSALREEADEGTTAAAPLPESCVAAEAQQ